MNSDFDFFVQDDEHVSNYRDEQKNALKKTISNTIEHFENFKDSNISVFISSTKTDLEDERSAVSELVTEMGLNLISMEHFGARTEKPLDTCLSELQNANIYICILGMRYGTPYKNDSDKENNELSYTEIEYRHVLAKANEQEIRILIYCIDEENAKIHPVYVDKYEEATKLESFKNTVKLNHVVYFYKDIEDLIRQVALDLRRDVLSILSKRDELLNENSEQRSIESGSITFTSEIDSAYIYQPIRISGKTTNINSTKIYLYLTKKQVSFPPEDSSIIPLTDTGEKYLTIPLNPNGFWSATLCLNNLSQVLSNGEYSFLAVSEPDLSQKNIIHSSSSLILKQGFIVLNYVGEVLTRGIPFTIKGFAETANPFAYLWICSKTKVRGFAKISINKKNGDFVYTFPDELVNLLMEDRQYFGIVNIPVAHERGDIWLEKINNQDYICSSKESVLLNDRNLESVVSKICEMLNDVGALHVIFSFITTAEPKILTPLSQQPLIISNKSTVLTISKDTNLSSGTLVVVEILSNHQINSRDNYKLVASLTTSTSGSYVESSFSVSFDISSLPSGKYVSRIILAANNKVLLEEKWVKL